MATKELIPPEQVRQLLDYDPETGHLTYRPRALEDFKNPKRGAAWNSRCAGKRAEGEVHPHGYLRVSLFRRRYFAHRLAWAHAHGEWPSEIDHINGVRDDNRLANLRAVSREMNMRNRRVWEPSKSGHRGVILAASGRWKVRICRKHIGTFATLEEAIAVRRNAEDERGFMR